MRILVNTVVLMNETLNIEKNIQMNDIIVIKFHSQLLHSTYQDNINLS